MTQAHPYQPTRLPHRLLAALAALITSWLACGPAVGLGDDVYYKDGAYTTFELVKQDTGRFGPNEHPVDLAAKDLEPILRAITLRADGLFANGDVAPLFSEEQARLLATWIPEGLRRAGPEQDVLFVLQRRARRLVLLSGNALTSGRVFYADGRLNIIIGEHDRARNREFERLFDTSGAINPYELSPGKRRRNSGAINAELLPFSGVSFNTIKGNVRDDWFVIDIPQAVAAIETGDYTAPPPDVVAGQPARSDELSSDEAVALQQEQEEMRREMEALREQVAGGSTAPAEAQEAVPAGGGAEAPARRGSERLPGSDIERRLRLLIQLREDGLITQEEFDAKRRDILSEL